MAGKPELLNAHSHVLRMHNVFCQGWESTGHVSRCCFREQYTFIPLHSKYLASLYLLNTCNRVCTVAYKMMALLTLLEPFVFYSVDSQSK